MLLTDVRFCPWKVFQPSLMFADKARRLPESGAPIGGLLVLVLASPTNIILGWKGLGKDLPGKTL